MSCFGGRMSEYRYLSIDRFDGENLESWAFFLSHAHRDHMVGLDNPGFLSRLKASLKTRLYCSDITKALLLTEKQFKPLEPYIETVTVDTPTSLTVTDEITGKEHSLLVTLLQAGHCPGSVMFLFEGSEGTVLYTGDFRLPVGGAAQFQHLHQGDRLKNIQSLYVDTTFLVPEAKYIPSREDCCTALINVVQSWISRGAHYVVRLNCKAKYGYEYLFIELCRRFDMKVHVNNPSIYQAIPEIFQCLTSDPSETQIHACRWLERYQKGRHPLPCKYRPPPPHELEVMSVTPSTMWFTAYAGPGDVIRKGSRHHHRVCFSFHSSYTEIRDFVGYIRPKTVHANVAPVGTTLEEAEDRLRDLTRSVQPESTLVSYQPLGSLRLQRAALKRKQQEVVHKDDENLFSDDDDTPPLQKRKIFISTKPQIPVEANTSTNGADPISVTNGKDEITTEAQKDTAVFVASKTGKKGEKSLNPTQGMEGNIAKPDNGVDNRCEKSDPKQSDDEEEEDYGPKTGSQPSYISEGEEEEEEMGEGEQISKDKNAALEENHEHILSQTGLAYTDLKKSQFGKDEVGDMQLENEAFEVNGTKEPSHSLTKEPKETSHSNIGQGDALVPCIDLTEHDDGHQGTSLSQQSVESTPSVILCSNSSHHTDNQELPLSQGSSRSVVSCPLTPTLSDSQGSSDFDIDSTPGTHKPCASDLVTLHRQLAEGVTPTLKTAKKSIEF
ncbi:protein artemis-like isoform X1 [Branchiostoma floridae]|uniref:Protein artemis n=1 Tax=Branchiostoma floridae TaxID=7739 RepID=A0A9J7L6R2_BRAFL|nr:protein artemis-like isoform X1 [Branchiostoma floridae]